MVSVHRYLYISLRGIRMRRPRRLDRIIISTALRKIDTSGPEERGWAALWRGVVISRSSKQ